MEESAPISNDYNNNKNNNGNYQTSPMLRSIMKKKYQNNNNELNNAFDLNNSDNNNNNNNDNNDNKSIISLSSASYAHASEITDYDDDDIDQYSTASSKRSRRSVDDMMKSFNGFLRKSIHHTSNNKVVSSTTNVFNTIKNETMNVIYSKRLVYLVIFIASAVFGTFTYYKLKNNENYTFHKTYNAITKHFISNVNDEYNNVLNSLTTLSKDLTLLTINDNITWPYFQASYFNMKSNLNRKISKTIQQSITPLVKLQDRDKWENYTKYNHEWIYDELIYDKQFYVTPETNIISNYNNKNKNSTITNTTQSISGNETIIISPYIYKYDENATIVPQDESNGPNFGPGMFAPIWQHSPYSNGLINMDIFQSEGTRNAYKTLWDNNLSSILGSVLFTNRNFNEPYADVTQAIYSKFYNNNEQSNRNDIVGLISSLTPLTLFFSDLLKSNTVHGLILVLTDPRKNMYTFRLDAQKTTYVGIGDLHEIKYDFMERSSELMDPDNKLDNYDYNFRLYPSSEMEDAFKSNEPFIYTFVVISIFIFTALIFAIYNYFVQNRQNKIMAALTVTSKVIASLFPANILDRLMKEAEEEAKNEAKLSGHKLALARLTQKTKLRNFLDIASGDTNNKNEDNSLIIFKSKPIADLYASATVVYADIVGFTAWSSIREPSQVFTLLETLFNAYDQIARRRRIFKVETIGDCYVAVSGVPHPRTDHAVAMARFARDCINAMIDLSRKLEMKLGPDTSDLGMRIGMHSGPVTAGILRGEKSRFQLFGDTVNRCAHVESSGSRNRIHLSQQTADLLINAGKSSWILKREDVVNPDVDTYWLTLHTRGGSKTSGSDAGSSDNNSSHHNVIVNEHDASQLDDDIQAIITDSDNLQAVLDKKIKRLVDWNTELLIRLLKQILAHRKEADYKSNNPKEFFFRRGSYDPSIRYTDDSNTSTFGVNQNNTVIHEVVEIIDMPEFDSKLKHDLVDPNSIELDLTICQEIKAFISIIASLYCNNPFHNFEHASHVTMSVSKLLSRIVAPDKLDVNDNEGVNESNKSTFASTLHDHTYGITSDPITQFACVFSALIHDVDHAGVPNVQLVKESAKVAQLYNNQSVAEQNSIDIAWSLFMEDSYSTFRQTLCPTSHDMKHFRQLVVNSVMATDIVDKNLKDLRNKRWDVAFQGTTSNESVRDQINRKATIVIEHLIQASDVSHTMQHWHVYCKWNEMFYHEMYKAYKEGRAATNPAEFWYKGEIGFFDYYIIPLAKKLKECGVFGVSSDEYLTYAIKNRAEWEDRGEEVVARMVERYNEMYTEQDI